MFSFYEMQKVHLKLDIAIMMILMMIMMTRIKGVRRSEEEE